MAGIFISYRRDDAAGDAGRLYDRLRDHFGADQVFRDVDTIVPGEQFTRQIEDRLARCSVLVALISKRWRGDLDDGPARLDDPEDFVRLEIATALRRGIVVIPALLEGAHMPRPEELPPELRPFMVHQAVELDIAHFHDDVTRLIRVLEQHVQPANQLRARLFRYGMIGAVAALLAIAAIVWLRADRGTERLTLRSNAAALTPSEVALLATSRGYYSAQSNPAGPALPAAYATRTEGGVAVVYDSATGLMWQHAGTRPAAGRAGATAHIAKLNADSHAGFADWRLPTLDEAMSLLRPAATNGYHIHPIFDVVSAPMIWTSDDAPSDDAQSNARGWIVYFYDGVAAREPLDFGAHVRAVRSAH